VLRSSLLAGLSTEGDCDKPKSRFMFLEDKAFAVQVFGLMGRLWIRGAVVRRKIAWRPYLSTT